MMRDADFGVVRLRSFGTFDFRIVDPPIFLKEVAATDHHFRLDEFADTMRSRIVSVFNEALASCGVPALDVATRYSELGDALLPLINPQVVSKHGIEALAKVPDEKRGLKEEKKSVKCESCFAISVFDPVRAAQRCDFCGSPAIVPVETMADLITPESLLPAVIPDTRVRDQLHQWYRYRWWAPNKLTRAALTDTLHGIYLPYWTFDAHVEVDWTAASGYHYYKTETFRDSNGKTQTRCVQRTRWENSSGNLAHFFDDDVVPGTVGVHAALLRKVEPFPTLTDLKPYDPAFVRGWTVERYQVDLRQASQTSRAQLENVLRQLCANEVPGDSHRNLRLASLFQGRTLKPILVPVWLASYPYGRKSFQVVVNGYAGKMAGEHPVSWVKITFTLLPPSSWC